MLEIHHGDALTVLRTLADDSVQCCITSPPYYGLRDYKCDGQIGLEKTPELFIKRLVDVFREVRRVLKPDGVLWVVVGDSYNAHPGQRRVTDLAGVKQVTNNGANGIGSRNVPNLKPKDLIGIPWMLAFALRSDGWWLRQDIIWSKPNPMPESVKDRCTKSHEYLFMLTKSARYFYNAAAIAEPAKYSGTVVVLGDKSLSKGQANGANVKASGNGKADSVVVKEFRNRRSVWTMSTLPTPEAHFATYPIDLVQDCILCATRADDFVLDPFTGAGTTGLACLKHGRRFVGIELNADYIKIAQTRANKYYSLFSEAINA